MSLNNLAEEIEWNLKDTISIIKSSKSDNKEAVEEKFTATIKMLFDGSEAIKQMIIDDLEGEMKND